MIKTCAKLFGILIPRHWINFAVMSFSQSGEDMLLREFFKGKEDGFFIDVGAHHPFRFSNTYLLYRRGWRGINIDALPGTKAIFDKCRKRDINIEIGVSLKEEELTYWSFAEPAFNTLDPDAGRERESLDPSSLLEKKSVQTMPLDLILERWLPRGTKIDLLTVDVEGFDLQVLRSNNWNKFRPKAVLVEIDDKPISEVVHDPVCEYLEKCGYALISKLNRTALFKSVG